MALLTVTEVAQRLGVSARRVQYLIARGELRALARGVVDDASVDRLLAARGGSRTRPWSEATAWAAVALLSDRNAPWVGDSQRSRLRGRLRRLDSPELVVRARARATASRYAGHPSTGPRLRNEIVDTAAGAAVLGLADTAAVDGYVSANALDQLIARHGLVLDDNGRFTIRATGMPIEIVAELAEAGPVLAALDLAESPDTRERRAGRQALTAALERFRD
ncbi:helix-turn-helix domain-containing protein [Dactylosporangium vinaceum]|uniref:Helix-turn-helix domain-containing protein n=1 Tax=Dactylosporangium vinaceum TaxID=53362 RepID=A0ABV5MF25_9ACTN|nr:helix-turn-helix domain-containing protein [Dactylosporangium vinaceum]UAB97019.1 helix-turn-helix domain-containing protein [Dactylosporangium vinaceum]